MKTLETYIDKIKFLLTGGVLESELKDENYSLIMDISLLELNRYYSTTGLVLVAASHCIDLTAVETEKDIKISSVASIHRTQANGISSSTTTTDPMYNSYWNQGSYIGYSQKWFYNYLSYNTLNQLQNTSSTDLDFREDPVGRKLYINYTDGSDEFVIEYVPKLLKVEDVNGEYWEDILSRLALAYAKITLGRIRTRFTQSNALWSQDGEKLLEEGNSELTALRERLNAQANFLYPLD